MRYDDMKTRALGPAAKQESQGTIDHGENPEGPSKTTLKRHKNQTVFRIERHVRKFTSIANSTLNDPSISWAAKGLIGYMLSKPPGWQFIEADIVRHSTNGRDSVRSIIRELVFSGYAIRKQSRGGDGRMGPTEIIVYETRELNPANPHPVDVPTVDGKPVDGKPVTGKTPSSNTNNINTDEKKTDDDHNRSSSPPGNKKTFLVPASRDEAEKIIDDVISLEYGGKPITRNLRQHLRKLLQQGALELPEGWEEFRIYKTAREVNMPPGTRVKSLDGRIFVISENGFAEGPDGILPVRELVKAVAMGRAGIQ